MRNAARPVLVLGSILACGLAGCFSKPLNLNVTQMGPPYRIVAYDQGRPVAESRLPAMSPDEQALAQWIEANRKGWRPCHGQHAPGKVVHAEGFSLNFTDKYCILTIPPDPHPKGKAKAPAEPIVLQKKLTPGDLELSRILNVGL